ncbi:MAG TPA: DUF2917 domain-containing protein [Polyangiaceae bacterium]|nr:DUF2917 domain-containing protein [Polyangiaceae bacterium]
MTFLTPCATQPSADASQQPVGRSIHYMAARAVFALPVSGQACVTCHSGELWVTGPGTNDIILRPGQCIGIRGPGRIVIEALAESRFGIHQRDGVRRWARSPAPRDQH